MSFRPTRSVWPPLGAILLTLVIAGCQGNYVRNSDLSIAALHYSEGHQLFIAVNEYPNYGSSFLTYGQAVAPGTTSVTIDGILWDTENSGQRSRQLWLLVAEDTNDDAVLSPGDRLLPIMPIVLVDGEVTTISDLIFTYANSLVLDNDFNGFVQLQVFMSTPGLVTFANPIHVVIGSATDLSGGNVTVSYSFADPNLAIEFYARTGLATSPAYAYAWWSPNGNLSPVAGDWVSHQPANAAEIGSADGKVLILSPYTTF
ncbi:MAG: hypothetical protein A2087_13765 [Spirochaetes bacterium GWD1_61_31]|nr:MAG: hypothetical protein A2Y37_13035 [Spirochaetes bacterium GWB1_60_80]OHD42296.1 MAG: hypothetical protein A2087_13765 [Spirochaetes bacterium GWD1_61_31]HAP44472.1 hypothetical protein [Spirochaetaceae bacterium]HAW86606.1 hypothetical protein [Spirochaetaceae bacterium]HAX36404.1 hypothetical protein [Spirochaetaceae bacterium]